MLTRSCRYHSKALVG
ncbi:hypothetical protein D047_4548A, partial [Vibrio parahaemolyticus VPTS-2010_2]